MKLSSSNHFPSPWSGWFAEWTENLENEKNSLVDLVRWSSHISVMGPTTVNIHEAKTHLSRLIERTTEGETIIIAKAGKPQVMLTPIPSPAPRSPGRFSGKIVMADDFNEPLPAEVLKDWEGQ